MGLYNKKGIYCIRNTKNNKMYIGSTYVSFGDRRDVHMTFLRCGTHHNKELQNDYDNQGENDFVFEIIEEIYSDNPDDYYSREMYYISLYDTFKNGYNKTAGGTGAYGTTLSKEKIRRLSDINRERMLNTKLSDSVKENMRKSRNKNNSRSYDNGKILTEEQVKNIKEELISGKRVSDMAKKYNVTVACISSINRNRTWKNIKVYGWDDYIERSK